VNEIKKSLLTKLLGISNVIPFKVAHTFHELEFKRLKQSEF